MMLPLFFYIALLFHHMQPINVAICSYGMSGKVFHGPLLEAHPGFRITKILERNRNDSARRHASTVIVRDYDEILEDPEVELVVVNTPDHLHYEMAGMALRSGKHVVVEKPVCLRSEQARELNILARDQGVAITVFHNRRWDGDFLTVTEVLKTGKLGRLVAFESHFDRYRKTIADSWKDRSNGTGTLYNLGSHLVDQALLLFGFPRQLFCDVRQLRDGARTDDSFDLFLLYNNVKCLLRSSYLVREPGPRFTLHGTEGSFLVWGTDPQEEALKSGQIPGSPGWGADPSSCRGIINTGFQKEHLQGDYPLLPGNYQAFYDNLQEVIRNGKPPEVTLLQAERVIRIIEAAYRSGRENRVVTLE
jgi:scyllo-inositol 2-dehydrogenase (NADP+)